MSAPTCCLWSTDADGEVPVTEHEETDRLLNESASQRRASDELEVAASAVAAVAVSLLDVDAVGLALHGRNGAVTRLSATSGLIGRLDRIQADLGQGPGLASFDVGAERFVADVNADQRYPAWSRAAGSLGMLSVYMTALTPLRDHGVSLDLYSHRAHGIGSVTVAAVAALALPAALDLGSMQRAQDVHATLLLRELVGQAQGILMERHGLTASRAAAALREWSRETGTPLPELALAVTTGVDLPLHSDLDAPVETDP